MAPKIGKIGLVGAGAVGGYYGLMLKKGGEDIHFHIRSNFEKVREDGKKKPFKMYQSIGIQLRLVFVIGLLSLQKQLLINRLWNWLDPWWMKILPSLPYKMEWEMWKLLQKAMEKTG